MSNLGIAKTLEKQDVVLCERMLVPLYLEMCCKGYYAGKMHLGGNQHQSSAGWGTMRGKKHDANGE